MVSKALLKSRWTTSTAFASSTKRVTVIEGDQGQAGPAFHKPMLTGPDRLLALQVPCDDTQDNLLHELPWH